MGDAAEPRECGSPALFRSLGHRAEDGKSLSENVKVGSGLKALEPHGLFALFWFQFPSISYMWDSVDLSSASDTNANPVITV